MAGAFANRKVLFHTAVAAAIITGSFVAFGPALTGEFVYDDLSQIVNNHLIQDPVLWGQAVSSDVWAFKGDREEQWSNYWRPAFMLWLGVNHALFGLEDTTGWHVTSILLHVAVTLLGYAVLLALGVGQRLAAAVAILFAVHPVHVESVAWISGSPDLLAAAGVLVSLWLLLRYLERPSIPALVASLMAFAFALFSKEIAIMMPAVVAVTVATMGRSAGEEIQGIPWRRVALLTLPYVLLAGLYYLARTAVLGQAEIETFWEISGFELGLNVPRLLFFYVGQMAFPITVGPGYSIRAMTLANLSVAQLALAFLATALVLVAATLVARSHRAGWVALALFLVPLLPAFNINVFPQDQIVHDRYLYLPSLGFLTLIVLGAHALIRRFFVPSQTRSETVCLVAATLLCIPLTVQSRSYSQAWTSEFNLWEWGVRVDPTSAFNQARFGGALKDAGRYEEALVHYNHAVSLFPLTHAYVGRADVLMELGRLREAAGDLQFVLSRKPDFFPAVERLGVVYQRAGLIREAAQLMRDARDRIPYRRCTLTSSLAALLYALGDPAAAQAELESVRGLVGRERTEPCNIVEFRLATILDEKGLPEEAAVAYARYLEVTGDGVDPKVDLRRGDARAALRRQQTQ